MPNSAHKSISIVLLLLLYLIPHIDSRAHDYAAANPEKHAAQSNRHSNESVACSSRLDASYHLAWQLIKDNTMFPNRLTDWQNWEHKYDGKLHQEKELADAIKKLLLQVKDEYSYFRDSSETQNHSLSEDERSVVSLKILSNKSAHITIKTFCSEHTAEEFEHALLESANADSYVIDLRDNHGGFVEQALLCYSMLVDKGKFVSIRGRQDGKNYSEIVYLTELELVRQRNDSCSKEARLDNLTNDKPMLVLVNENTKSAAEMLAGALRDTKRAELMGTRTFGKGVVQNTWDIEPGCSLKIATAKFYLPGGDWIHGRGIEPDIYATFSGGEPDLQANEIRLYKVRRQTIQHKEWSTAKK